MIDIPPAVSYRETDMGSESEMEFDIGFISEQKQSRDPLLFTYVIEPRIFHKSTIQTPW